MSVIRTHIFTDVPAALIFKQLPQGASQVDGVSFTCGLDIPNDIDVLLVYIRASYSIPTMLPKERSIFFAGEPDVIHHYKRGFLEQFGLVYTSSRRSFDTIVVRSALCCMPFVGIDFRDQSKPLSIDAFKTMSSPEKDNRISIVTSTKAATPYHRARLKFIERLTEKIPDRIALYGWGHKTVDDKKDALLPHKYHLALENGGGPDVWTEKLSDPYLCNAYPFYYGCTNVEAYFPELSFSEIDIEKPDQAIEIMVAAQDAGLWQARQSEIAEAKELILGKYNLMHVFASLAKQAAATPVSSPAVAKPRLILSERSLWPEEGARGGLGGAILRRGLQLFDPTIELRFRGVKKKIEARRIDKRNKKRAKAEAGAE